MQVISDLHLETKGISRIVQITKSILKYKTKYLALLGDICGPSQTPFLDKVCKKYDRVLYVPGNHEHYGGSVDDKWYNELDIPNLHVLDNKTINIDGVKFVGSTLWANCKDITQGVGDFRNIIDFSPERYRELFRENVNWLENEIEEGCIVLTHHLPSQVLVHPKYEHSKYNTFFASNCDHLFELRPRMWLHGHTHTNHDFQYRGVRFVCNPLGYEGEETGFRYNKIVSF